MTEKEKISEDIVALRQRAEDLLKSRALATTGDIAALSPEDIRKTLHELRVHQIELEMQNEALRAAEAELEKSRFRYFDLYDLAPVGYCHLSEQGQILEANLTAATLLGTARNALVKQPISRFILDEDQDIYYLHRKKLFETGEPQECELRLVKSDGAHFWAHLKEAVAQAEDGAPVSRVVLSDITERKQGETYREMGQEILQILNESGDLQESIQRVLAALKTWTGVDAVGLRLQEGEDFPYFIHDGFSKDFLLTENTLLERNKDGSVCRDKDGNVRLECTCGLVISGKTDPSNPLFTQGGSSWTNDSFPLLDLPSDQDPRLHPRNNCIHQGYASVALIPVRIQDQMYSRETCIRHGFSSMAQVPVRTSDRIVGLIQLNDKRKGRFTLQTIEILEGIAAHIGSALMRKRAEEALRESEERYRTILNEMAEGYHEVDLAGNFTFSNEAFLNLFGYSSEEMAGSNFSHYAAEESSSKKVYQTYNEIYKTGNPVQRSEWDIIRKDGQRRTLEYSAAVLRDSKNIPNGFRGIVRDITERKQIEQEREKLQAQLTQSQKMESIGSLAGGIAHDFNNLLFPIVGLSEMMMDDFLPGSPEHHNAQEIFNAGTRGRELVQQILSFSRQSEHQRIPVHIQKILKEVLKLCRATIPADITISRDIQTDCTPVMADPTQIHQIAMNLITNAYHAVESTGGTITVQLKETDSIHEDDPALHVISGRYAVMSVSDTGTGIDPVVMNKIFDPYFTTKEKGKGTGLGLATVYGIVKAHGGDIKVHSELGKGSSFHVYLPVLEKSADVAPEKQQQPLPTGTEHILLVDDEAPIVHMEQQMLERLGYCITSFCSSVDALAAFRTDPSCFDLIITDMNMPNLNGMLLAEQLTSIRSDIHVIICTGFSERINKENAAAKGIRGFLMKPLVMKDLAQKVREVLDT